MDARPPKNGISTCISRRRISRHRAAPKLFTEEIEKATNGELKVRLHLAGTLQINASNITQAVGENVVQIGDDLFNSGNIPVAGIPRLPMLIQSYEDFAKADAVLKPYIDKAFGQKGSTVLASYTYPMQFIWGRKKLESLDDIKGMKLRVAQPEQGEFVRRFGGTSITMSAPEVPSALDRGVVDGIFTAGVGAVLWKDLLKYGYVLIVNVNNSYFIANTEAYNKLSPDLQGKLRKVAQDIGALGPGHDAEGRSGIGSGPHRRGIHLHQGEARRESRARLTP